jgi:RND family efflux transporter MFP subunit
MPPALVRVGEVRRETVQEQRLVTGRVEPSRVSLVAAEESGRVMQAPPDVGLAVEADQVLARLDDTLIRAQRDAAAAALQEAHASMAEAQAEVDLARRVRERYEKLVPTDAASELEYDQAVRDEQVTEARLENIQALLAQRKAQLAELDERLDNMVVRAPFDGFITRKEAEEGQWLSPGQPVVEVVAIDPVDAVIAVPEQMIGALSDGAKVQVQISGAGVERMVAVDRIVPDADRRSRTFPVYIRLDNPTGVIKPGMTAEAELPTGRQVQAITVPRDAVQVTPTGPIVFVNRNGMAQAVNVRLMFSIADRMVIDAPLAAGEQVVVEGNERLTPGMPQPLIVKNGSEPAPPASQPTEPDAPPPGESQG